MSAPPRLGKYEIRREIGRGSMGVVYEAFDPFIQRPVAIKVIRQDEFQPSQVRELLPRLRREAQAAGRLNHTGIVAIYDYGEDQTLGGSGLAYIAMELIDGRELKDYFDASHPFTRADIVRIMGEVLAALQHAHERGVTHRDIKPSNVILLRNGSVKVADFGVARLDSSEMTQAGTMIGTPMYMAPEQILGLPVDGRCDLFACGVVLYQFLTGGDRPFTGSLTSVMQKVLHTEPVPVTQLNAELAPEWDGVLRKALAKKPEQRFPSAQAMAEAILAAALAPPPNDQVTVLLPPRQPMGLPPAAPFRPMASSPPATDLPVSPRTPTAGVPRTPMPTPVPAPTPMHPTAPYRSPGPQAAAVPAAPPAQPPAVGAPRGPNRSFQPAPPATGVRPGQAPTPPGPLAAGAPTWAPRGAEPVAGGAEEGEWAPTVRYTLKHLRPDGTEAAAPSVPPRVTGNSGFGASPIEAAPRPTTIIARRPWLLAAAGALAVALLIWLVVQLWPGSRTAAAPAPAPVPARTSQQPSTAPPDSATGTQSMVTAGANSLAQPGATYAASAAPAGAQPAAQPASSAVAATATSIATTGPAGLSPAPAAKAPDASTTPPGTAAPSLAKAPPARTAEPASPPTLAAPAQPPEWRQRVARLEAAPAGLGLAESLALLLEPLTPDERALLNEFETQARQRPGAQVVAVGVQEGYLRTAWSTRQATALKVAVENTLRRCGDFPARGCSTVMLAGSFQPSGLTSAARELGTASPAMVRARLLRNVDRTLAEWRGDAPGGAGAAGHAAAAAPGMAPATVGSAYPGPATPSRSEAIVDPARGDWPAALGRLRTEAPASLASALELLLHVTDAEERDRLRQLETALKRLRWKSAAALGERNGYLWLNVAQGESRTQWAQEQALSTCANQGGSPTCVLVMLDGQFHTSGLAGLGGRLGGRSQAAVREAFMRQLQRALQTSLS